METPQALHRKDTVSGLRWLAIPYQPDEATRTALKAAGWRWSAYRQEWYTNRKFAPVPEMIPWVEGEPVTYAAERGERLEARAARASATATGAQHRAHQILDQIPLGQPILVGHHSERRHRRDLARADGAMQIAVEEGRKADRLTRAAEDSRQHQARLQDRGACMRRVAATAEAVRKLESQRGSRWWSVAEEWKLEVLQEEHQEAEQRLAAAGGAITAEEVAQAGPLIIMHGHVVKVAKVNRKTVKGVIALGGAAGMTGSWDLSWYQGPYNREEETA